MDWSELGINTRGHTRGEIKTLCPQCSHKRKHSHEPCLSVNLDKGFYNCHHCGFSGATKMTTKTYTHREPYKKPTFTPAPISEKVLMYLSSRGLTDDVLLRNQVTSGMAFMPQKDEEVECIQFPYIKNGEVVNIKFRDAEKNFRQVGGAEKTFYKYDDFAPITIITEGEPDALALEVAGFRNAVSVPDGAPPEGARVLDNKFTYLDDPIIDTVERFILAVDNDGPGKVLEEELARRLGRDRCWRVVWPEGCKDANECLVKHGIAVLKNCIDLAQPIPVDGVFNLLDFSSELDDIFEHGLPKGVSTGWPNVDELYTPIEGQWTLVTGIPGMGKSEWLDALAVNLAVNHQWVFGVCSPENQPVSFHASKLISKFLNKPLDKRYVTKEEYADGKEWANAMFKFILPESRSLDEVLDKTKALVRRHGLRGLIIDPYNELLHSNGRADGRNETEYISEFLSKLRWFCRDQLIHIWLVAHPKMLRKEGATYPVPTGYDVAGSAHFYNKSDNIVVIHRDKTVANALTEIHVQKIRSRWLGALGSTMLWWDPVSGVYSQPIWTTYGVSEPETPI